MIYYVNKQQYISVTPLGFIVGIEHFIRGLHPCLGSYVPTGLFIKQQYKLQVPFYKIILNTFIYWDFK